MPLSEIKASSICHQNGDYICTDHKGWHVNVLPYGNKRYEASLFLMSDEDGASDQGCFVDKGVCNTIAEVKEYLIQAVDDLEISASEAKKICQTHNLGMAPISEVITLHEASQ